MAEMSDRTYRVVVTRERDAWLADVPGIEGTHTWAKNLPRLDHDVREAIALAEDLPDGAEATLQLDYAYHTGDKSLDAITAKLRAERERIQQADRHLAEQTASVAEQLVARHSMSVRDVAALLAVSPQRVSQVAPQPKRSGSEGASRSRKLAPAASIEVKKTGKKVPGRTTSRVGLDADVIV
jgi:predicted transcriptional regulator